MRLWKNQNLVMIVLGMGLFYPLSAWPEVQSGLSLTAPSFVPGSSGSFNTSQISGASASGSGSMLYSYSGIVQMSLTSGTGRFSTLGGATRVGIGFDSFILFQSFLTTNYLTVASTNTTCPASPGTYTWLMHRFRSPDLAASSKPMKLDSNTFYGGGTLTYDPNATPVVSGGNYFDMAGPTLTANPTYGYGLVSGVACSGGTVKLTASGADRPLDQYGTLYFGSNGLVWISGLANPAVIIGLPQQTLDSTIMESLANDVLTGRATYFSAFNSQTQKNVYFIPDSSGTTFTLRSALDITDTAQYSSLGTLTCTNLNSPTTGFCSGTLTLSGNANTGRAVCHLSAQSSQHVLNCEANVPGSNAGIGFILQTPVKSLLAVNLSGPAQVASAGQSANITATLTNLTGRPITGLGNPSDPALRLSAPFSNAGAFSGSSSTGGPCGTTLKGYGTCTVTIAYNPSSLGTTLQTYRVEYNNGLTTVNATAPAIGTAGLSSIAITPATAGYNTSTSQQFTATATYSDNSTQNITSAVTWASSNTSIATITSAGNASFTSTSGATNITGTIGSTTGTRAVNSYSPAGNPTSLTGALANTYDISLSWSSAGGATTGFKVAYNSGYSVGSVTAPADCASGTVIDAGNVTSYTLTNAVANKTYAFRVCAYNAAASLSSGATVSVAATTQRIFTGSNASGGNLGGLYGADATCQTKANAQSLGGTWKAVLSDSNTSAYDHIKIVGKQYNLRPTGSGGNQLLSNDSSGFWAATHNASGAHVGMSYDETATVQTNASVWTNTTIAGAIKSTTNTCTNWTSSSAGISGQIGNTTSSSANAWTDSSAPACSSNNRIYCIDGQDPTPNPPYGPNISVSGASQLSLSWSIASNNSDSFDDTGIQVWRSTDGSSYSLLTTKAAHATSHTDTGLTDGVTYYYKLRAINLTGGVTFPSNYTSVVNATALATMHRTFTGSNASGGNLGGISGADAICQTKANAQSLGGTWKAILSDANIAAIDHIKINGKVYNMRASSSGGAQLVANDSSGFWAATHNASGAHVGMSYDETATVQTNASVWTNTTIAGAIKSTTNTCTNWTSSSAGVSGQIGNTTSSSANAWTDSSGPACSGNNRIYCIDGQDPTPNSPSGVKIGIVGSAKIGLLWTVNSSNSDSFDDTAIEVYRSTDGSSYSLLTTLAAHATGHTDTGLTGGTTYYYKIAAIRVTGGITYRSNYSSAVSLAAVANIHRVLATVSGYTGNLGGLSGADSTCQTEANNASLGGTWKAILSDSSTDASSRITISYPVYNIRPLSAGGAQLVASNSAGFWSTTHTNAANYTTGGTGYGATNAWTNVQSTGAKKTNSTSFNCTNWTSANVAISGYYGTVNNTSTAAWIDNSSQGCSISNRLYCIEQ